MKEIEMHPTNEEKIDRTLQRFFRAEMPEPWPGFCYAAEETPVVRPVSPWKSRQKWLSRLALAACVALLFLGYLTLGSVFPGGSTNRGGWIQDPSGHIGNRPRVRPLNAAPSKIDAPVRSEDDDLEPIDRPTLIHNPMKR